MSVRTLWEEIDDGEPTLLSVPVSGHFVEQTSGLLVGTISLRKLFEFMRLYQRTTSNLDQLYEKNVRQFLGGRRKINRGIANTLEREPEKFGLYNNGITIVVSDYEKTGDMVTMYDPYVVNGCQTTKTIWQVLDSKLNVGGTGQSSAANAAWEEKLERGGVVAKIVLSDEAEIVNITKFTNSQNSVREQDFIALNSGFQGWARAMENDYNIFLEIQRGGAQARKAWEKQHPNQPKFDDYVNAFDLIKVYGAGWMGAPGLAFGKNAPFLPNGSVYKRILNRQEGSPAFGARDLCAAYKIKCLADTIGFGRNADRASRRQSRYLFYHVIIQMLRSVVLLTPDLMRPSASASDLTDAVLTLGDPQNEGQLDTLSNGALSILDGYLTAGSSNSAHNEISFTEIHNGDLNGFLKAENLGTDGHSPNLVQALAIANQAFTMSGGKDQVASALLAGVG